MIMRKTWLLLVFLLNLSGMYASENNKDWINADSVLIVADSIELSNVISEPVVKESPTEVTGEIVTRTADRYKIYPTSNMYNFLKLDTRTGRIYRVQWSFEDQKRYETYVNYTNLVYSDDDLVDGRFEIYTTENIYSFLLLDKINGRVWHCQWGFESSKNWIERIY